jgi:hypothetical protein
VKWVSNMKDSCVFEDKILGTECLSVSATPRITPFLYGKIYENMIPRLKIYSMGLDFGEITSV